MKKVLLSILCAITFTCMAKAESVVAIFGGYNYTGSVTDQVKFSEGSAETSIDWETLKVSDICTLEFGYNGALKNVFPYILPTANPPYLMWPKSGGLEVGPVKGVTLKKISIYCTSDTKPQELYVYYSIGSDDTFTTTEGGAMVWTGEKTCKIGFSDNSTELHVAYIEIEYSKGSSAIDSVIADSNAPVEYFNLLGAKVANPKKGGIYIRRQGKTVSKVIL